MMLRAMNIGHADTCEEAKAAVERNWQAWLTAAGLLGEDVMPPSCKALFHDPLLVITLDTAHKFPQAVR